MKVVAIKSIADVSSGNTPSRRKSEYWNGSIPWITTGELESGYVTASKECVTEKALKETALKLYHKGTVLIAMYGQGKTRGTAAVLGIEATVNQACAVLTVHSGCSKFLFYQLQNSYHAIRRLSNTGNQENLNAGIIKNFKILWPDELEQQKIATILSTQDKVIELKEKRLAQKQQQKKYLMQQLLTGKKRLPGFNEKWKVEKFSEIFDFLSTNTLSRDNLFEGVGAIQNIHYGDILTKFDEVIDLDCVCLPSIKESAIPNNCATVKSGDIIIADTAEDLTAGKAVEVQNIGDRVIYSGLHTMLCRPKEQLFSDGWLGFYMNSEAYHKQLIPYIAGVKVMAISKSNIVKTYIAIPSKAEQAAIVEILSTADREIDLIQKFIEAEKQKKKALMQLLLTGKVRVKDE
jgi:hypothetical protein